MRRPLPLFLPCALALSGSLLASPRAAPAAESLESGAAFDGGGARSGALTQAGMRPGPSVGRRPAPSRAEERAEAQAEEWPTYIQHLGRLVKSGLYPAGRNTFELLIDGKDVKARVLEDVAAARHFINIMVYIWQPDEVGRAFAQTLAGKVAEGITVRAILDASGSFGDNEDEQTRGKELRGQMIKDGIGLRLTPAGLPFVIHRNHRKLMVMDGPQGSIAYTGGMNIGSDYQERWHDQQTRVQGPAATIMHQIFIGDWNAGSTARETLFPRPRNVLPPEDDLLSYPLPDTGAETYVLTHTGGGADRNIKAAYLLALDSAKKSICIENPYVTDPDFFNRLRAAARRIRTLTKGQGKVQFITPRNSDSMFTQRQTRAQYDALKEAGVEVYEWPGMTHLKVASIDDEWATFGSSNLDSFSVEKNDEMNLIVMDKAFASEVAKRICAADVPRSIRK